jgi:PEP-CTERM motif
MQLNVNVISGTPEPASWSLMMLLTIVSGICAAVFMARRREGVSL